MTDNDTKVQGIHYPVPQDQMQPSAKKLRDNYAIKPNAPFYQRTFGLWMCIDTWYENGLDKNTDLDKLFMFDPPGFHPLGQLGWCEGAFYPTFEEKILEDRGDHELVQDTAGRAVLYFKGRRQGFMPEYLGHPVTDTASWKNNVKWRLDPENTQRLNDINAVIPEAIKAAKKGLMIQQNLVGGYMFLRSLMGPEKLLYVFYDNPELVHDCMKTWLALADKVIAQHQKHVTLDEVYLAEDICYNHGSLISPDMIKEFLFPYYQQLITNIKSRQLDPDRHLYVQVDTDGLALPVIDLYADAIGMDVMGPFEVASGCDVVEVGKKWPSLVLYGGIDKRVLNQHQHVVTEYLESVLIPLKKRGGYIPTCDHGVPPEVSWQQYLHYRKKCIELGS